VISLKQILSKSTLARNAVWMLGGRGVRMVIQAIYFLVIARALGASQYVFQLGYGFHPHQESLA